MGTMRTMTVKRASFSSELQALRDFFPTLLPLLEKNPDWYGSVFFERKTARTYMANLRQTNVSENVSMGAVLRIYDGYTLFEQASDDLDFAALRRSATELAARVEKSKPAADVQKRAYSPPTWTDRLKAKLEDEIKSQIPNGATATTPVHFGIAYEADPRLPTTEKRLSELKALVARCVEFAPQEKIEIEELSYVMARQSFSEEESIFIDRESNLSQTLFRLALTVVTMSGADRTLNRVGGLGGLEAIEFNEAEIRVLLRDLHALKNAERMSPGKYRVLMSPTLAGVLAHEAFGHSQEGDTCARGRSKAWELHQSGERVGNEHATILNNPAIFSNGGKNYAAWGSYFFDEEGWLAQEHVLLDQGKLKSPMTNLTSALRLGVPRTANGKRESWSNGVYTRQTNTYFSPGDSTLDELVERMGDGYLATEAAGGMEDPKGMGIQVGIQYLKEVKAGKLTGRLLKGPAGGDIQMTGYTPDVLESIIGKSKIDFENEGKDTAKHPFNDAGGCGKYHKEFVYAGCGGPYLLLDGVTLG